MKITVDETKLKYIGLPQGFLGTLGILFKLRVLRILTISPINPPYAYRGWKDYFTYPTYKELGKSIYFNPELMESIKFHLKRTKIYNFLEGIIYYPLGVTIICLIVFGIFPLQMDVIGSVILSIPLFAIICLLCLRITGILLDKSFADTLSALSGIYLILILQHDCPVTEPSYKRYVLEKLRILRKNVVLLSQTFGVAPLGTVSQTATAFKKMETFVLETEQSVISPDEGTKQKLLENLYPFVEILVTGEYGKLKSNDERAVVQPPETPKPPMKFGEVLVRSLLSVFPFLILLALYFVPEKITAIGLDTTTVFLVSLAWILLVIDASLKLGIVERAAGLAKTMKEVSKL